MKQNITYDTNQQNVNRMIEIQRQKINHLKMLNTIYQKKSFSFNKEEKQIDKDRSLRINNQLLDKERKWRETQKQIGYENGLLRNKLIQIYVPKEGERVERSEAMKTNQSLDSIYKDKTYGLNFGNNHEEEPNRSRTKLTTHGSISPQNQKRAQTQRELHQTNAKFFMKLSNIQSDLMPKLKLQQHSKDASYLKQMLMKKSPQRNLRMKKFVQRTISERPKIHLPMTKSYRESTSPSNYRNPEQPFVFY